MLLSYLLHLPPFQSSASALITAHLGQLNSLNRPAEWGLCLLVSTSCPKFPCAVGLIIPERDHNCMPLYPIHTRHSVCYHAIISHTSSHAACHTVHTVAQSYHTLSSYIVCHIVHTTTSHITCYHIACHKIQTITQSNSVLSYITLHIVHTNIQLHHVSLCLSHSTHYHIIVSHVKTATHQQS